MNQQEPIKTADVILVPRRDRTGSFVTAHDVCSFCDTPGYVAQLHGTKLSICGECTGKGRSKTP